VLWRRYQEQFNLVEFEYKWTVDDGQSADTEIGEKSKLRDAICLRGADIIEVAKGNSDLERYWSIMILIREQEIVEQLQHNNYKLLGQISIDDNMYKKLVENAVWKIEHIYMQMRPRPDLVLSLALVQVAARCYKEGTFWRIFNEELGIDISTAKQNYLGQIFIKTVRTYNLFELNREENNTQMFVENIKAHAFVTNYYMSGFYDFAYAYYENNLFRQIPDEIIDDLEDLSVFMSGTLKSNKDAITDGNELKKAVKSYKLLKSTRAVFTQCSPSVVQKIFYPILVMIDSYFYEGEIPSLAKNRFEQGFIDWYKENETSKEINSSTRAAERRLTSHSPFIQVDIEHETFYLIVPAQKFRAEDCDGRASVLVIINEYIEEKQLELYKSFGIYISEPVKMPIVDIFDRIDIEVKVKALTSKNFHINKSQYRVFNDQWKHINKFSSGHNYMLTKKGTTVSWKEEDLIDSSEEYRLWNYYSANIGEESVCYVDKHPLSIIGEFSIAPIFDNIIEKFIIYKNGKEIIATRKHPAVSFVVDNQEIGGTALMINSHTYMLSYIAEKTCYPWLENKNKIAVTIFLEDLLCHAKGYFKIDLNVPGKSNQTLCEYVAMGRFNCRFSKLRYMYDLEAELTVTHDNVELSGISEEWKVLNIENSVSITYSIPIRPSLSKVRLDFIMDSVFTLEMPMNVFAYGFSLADMRIKKEDYIWYTDIKEILYIKLPSATWLGVYWGRDNDNMAIGVELSPGLFRIDISDFVRKIQSEYKKRWQYLNISYIDNKKRNVPLPAILRNIFLEPYFELEYSDGKAFIDIDIKGNAIPYLTVKNFKTEEVVINHREVVNGRNELPELSMEGYYDLYPTMEEADDFGFDVTETALRIKHGVGCIDMDNLANCKLIIYSIVFKEEALSPDYEHCIYLTEKENKNTYLGFMNCMKRQNGKYDKNTLKKLGKIRLILYQLNEEIRASMQLYSYKERAWMDPFYDTDRNILLSPDNPLLDKVQDPYRFLLLDSAFVEYAFDRNRLRRTR